MLCFIYCLNNATTTKYAGRIGACGSLNISNSPIAISAENAKNLCIEPLKEFPVLIDTENISLICGDLINY